MPIEVITDGYVSINAVDLSDHVESVELQYSKEIFEAPVMGDTGKRRLAGLADAQATINFRQDYAATKVDATLFPLVGVQTAVKIRKSKTDAISATNPEYQFNGMIPSLPVIAATVGQVHNAQVTILQSDGVALVRDVTP